MRIYYHPKLDACSRDVAERRLRCSRSHGALHPWPGGKIVVNKIVVAIVVDQVGRRIKKHTRMAGAIMATKVRRMNSVIDHVQIGRSSNKRRRRFMRRRRYCYL